MLLKIFAAFVALLSMSAVAHADLITPLTFLIINAGLNVGVIVGSQVATFLATAITVGGAVGTRMALRPTAKETNAAE